jgi:hypothetical protein
MYRISKTFTLEAAHRLNGLSEGHKCGRLHEHSYTVQVVLVTAEPPRRVSSPTSPTCIRSGSTWTRRMTTWISTR